MAHTVEFTKDDTVNGEEVKKGEKRSLGGALYKKLKAKKTVKDFVEKKKKEA